MKKGIISILALSLAIASCNKDKSNSGSDGFTKVENINDLNVPSSFNWNSSKYLMTDISVEGVDGVSKSQVRIDIYDVDPYLGGKVLFSGFTNAQGKLEAPIKIATKYNEVIVVANALGVGDNRITATLTGNTVRAHFSGVPEARVFEKHSSAGGAPTPATNFAGSDLGSPGVFYLGAFNANGIPAGMTSVPVGQPYLDNLALVLPEKNHLPCDPVRQALLADLFCNQVTTSKDDAEVAVTFLGEGAGYKNALAYYYYPAGSPPASRAAIDSVFVIFPNASTGGANMTAGDRVVIGTFPKNTTIEWVLLSDMWDGTSVHYAHTPSKTNFFFGDDAMNNDMGYNTGGCTPDPAFNQHMISFTDNLNGEDIQMFAFEDIRYPYGDYDFNDCIFYATGDLYPSCAPQLSVPTPGQSDSDGDGIIDQYDDEPNNPNVACLIEYDGTLLFEDLWPSKGDYDFNDLVTGYVITHAIHADGYVHEVRADYTAKAMGAGYNNGFGTVLSSDLVKADIASITGRSSTGGFPMDGDLTATPGSDLVMYNWDATKSIVSNDINGGAFFNTKVGGGKGNFVTENIVITMAPNAVDQWELGLPPYNPFIFADQDDTREIHLADMAPSSLNDNSRFGTANDDSDGISRFYKTASPANLPWALDIPAGAFEWPLERVDILTAYPNFGAWAMSGGMVNTDWYDFPAAGQTYTP